MKVAPQSDDTRYFSLSEIPKRMKELGYPRPHKSIGYRWASNGVGGHRLKSEKIGGRRVTCDRWLTQFLNQLNSGEGSRTRTAPPERAHAYLEEEGFV